MKPTIRITSKVSLKRVPTTLYNRRKFTEKTPEEETQDFHSTINKLSSSVQTRTVKLNEGVGTELKPGPQLRSGGSRNFDLEEEEGKLSAPQLDVVMGLYERDPSQTEDLAQKYGVDAVLLSQAMQYVAIPEIHSTARGKRFSVGPKGATFTPPKNK